MNSSRRRANSLARVTQTSLSDTPLDLILRNAGIEQVAIVGCSTDVGMQTTARAAHDLDYACTVIGDCCIAPSDEDHEPTLRMLSKVTNVVTLDQFIGQQVD
jgi:nicotinamidase-related amidase